METIERYLDPSVWGSHFWFVMLTIAIQYPNTPNDVIKKKYYRFFTELETFLPCKDVKKTYKALLNEFPINPYLDSRLSLLKWLNFVHNKYNQILNKEEVELYKGLEKYYENYKKEIEPTITFKKRDIKYGLLAIFLIIIIFCTYLFNK